MSFRNNSSCEKNYIAESSLEKHTYIHTKMTVRIQKGLVKNSTILMSLRNLAVIHFSIKLERIVIETLFQRKI